MQKNTALPISHVVSIARLPQKGMPVLLVASHAERDLLAKAQGLLAVDCFEANILVSKWRREGVRITGNIVAEIIQTCSISLDPLNAKIETEIDALYVLENSKLAKPKFDDDGEMILDAQGPDTPETFVGDTLDIGAIAEEFFALALDPYPRKEGAELQFKADIDQMPSVKVSPFAILSDYKQKQ